VTHQTHKRYWKMTKIKGYEQRTFSMELRAKDDESRTIVGHAAVFNKLSEDFGGFREMIMPGAFDDVLGDDVRALVDHQSHMILGRTKSNTLRLFIDEEGLRYEVDVADTTAGNDLLVSVRRGDVDQSSFGFTIKTIEWDDDDGKRGFDLRKITKVKRLYDVSPVTFPAYPDASVAKRGYDAHKESRGQSLAGTLNTLIDGSSRDRSDVIAAMASAAGIAVDTVQNILSADINCPPLARLEGFAKALNVTLSRLQSAAEKDGCEYDNEGRSIACGMALEQMEMTITINELELKQ